MAFKKRIVITLTLSLTLHIILFLLIPIFPTQKRAIQHPLHLTLLKKKIKQIKKKKIDPKNTPQPKQIVDIKEPLIKRKPKKPNYLAKYDQHVQKERKVKSNTHHKRKKRRKKRSRRRKRSPKKARQQIKPQKKIVEKKKRDRLLNNKKKENINNQKPSQKQTQKQNNGESREKNQPKPFQIEFDQYQFDQITQKIGSNDYLPNVKEGETISLETLAYEFTDYYLKIKRRLSKEWHPEVIYKKYDPYRKIYGVKDRYTLLKVSIDQEGYLKEITVKKSCGLKFLDQEAVRAFEAAQPFKIVPKPLIEKKGYFSIIFGFYVDNPNSPSIFYK